MKKVWMMHKKYKESGRGNSCNNGRNPGGGRLCLSIWALLAKSSFYKILAVLLVMVIVEAGWFCYRRQELYDRSGIAEFYVKEIFLNNKMPLLFLTVLGLTFFILLWTEDRLEGKSKYTMMRLRVTRQQLFVIKTIYNVLCLILVFAAQICLVFWMIWKCKGDMNLEQNAPQLYFFAFYSNRFLHCLLPMAETGKWVRNGLLVLAWGMQAAGMKGKSRYALPVCLFIVEAYWFESNMGVNFLDIEYCVINAVIIVKEVLCIKYAKLM